MVIGGQKSGTTSLYKYLSSHPEIYMPPEKELAFFSDPEKARLGVDYYLNEYFAKADRGKIAETIQGEASPQYMSSDAAASRIAEAFPNVKLIAILRNPVARTYSHYRMAVRRQLETRTFDRCIDDLLQAEPSCSTSYDMERDFIKLGEYGRILTGFLKSFKREQIIIVFTEELGADPAGVMSRLFKFLGVDSEFRSQIMGTRYHQSGTRRFVWIERLVGLSWVRAIIRSILPPGLRRKLGYWFVSQAVVRPETDSGPDELTKQKLVKFFQADVDLLEKQFAVRHPWHEFRSERADPSSN